MSIPRIEWDESNPSGMQEKSLGGQRIREMKTQFREMFSVDHIMDSSGNGDTWGYHNKATLYIQTADPIPYVNTGCFFCKDVAWNGVTKTELHWVNENDSDDIIQITSQGDVICGISKEVRMWSGTLATIPKGWSLCDGTGGTPNLIGKFIMGINTSSTDPGTTREGDSMTLEESNLPAHTHTTNSSSYFDGSHRHHIYVSTDFAGSFSPIYVKGSSLLSIPGMVSIDGTHSHNETTIFQESVFDNRPNYVELAFIVKD